MITYKSLKNPNLRLRQLRAMLHRLPSLKWKRYALKHLEKKYEGDLAIVKLLEDVVAFLRCTYSGCPDIPEDVLGRRVSTLITSLENLLRAVHKARDAGAPVSTKAIASVTSSITSMYRYTRSISEKSDCTRHWIRLGLLTPVVFD